MFRYFANLFWNYSLERKVFIATSLVILLAVPLTGAFSYYEASRILQGYAYNAANQMVNQLSGYMNNELKNISDRMYLINSSEAMKSTLNWSRGNSRESYTRVFNNMFTLFSQMRVNSTTIKEIYMYTPRGEFFDGPFKRTPLSFQETPYYEEVLHTQKNRWLYLERDPLFAGEGDVVSLLTRPTSDSSYLEENSYVVITLSTEKFINNLKSIQLSPQGFSLILDETGKPIFRSEESAGIQEFIQRLQQEPIQGKPPHFEMEINRETFLVSHADIPFVGWQSVVVQPKAKLLENVRSIQYVTTVMTLVLLVCSFLLNKFIAQWVTNPLRKLMKLMNQVKLGNLSVRFASEHKDEIGQLGHRFNDMLQQIQQLLHEIVDEGRAKRKAEMRALQAQINPHFLYNTLDELYWKSLEFEDPTAPDIILSLSRFFRLSLNKGNEETTIAHEIEHVEYYLKLVNHQYKRQFSFEISLDERAARVAVPNIILQPLVENCVLHAFKQNDYRAFQIHISAFLRGEWAILQVKDNGIGMEPQLVERLNSSSSALEHEAGPGVGYAISNIKERLGYFFGERARLYAESQPGIGTVMEIRIRVEEVAR
ncbi:sensor histidine kinase [Paenibacillus filicis]|uniref:Sensor histidine kinase n=1 Tax=Paenibacillus filicis TaxID=669464 RepID=A0ABU9DVC7_9BACL